MRVPAEYVDFFRTEVGALRPGAAIYLFGSRIADDRKGGDVDILVLSDPKLSWDEGSQVRRRFWDRFGFQKLDLVCFRPEEPSAFKELVLLDAIRL